MKGSVLLEHEKKPAARKAREMARKKEKDLISSMVNSEI
jgi:hypothetical protein